jgi:predicted transcriptional regulator
MVLAGIITDRDIVVRHVAECSEDCEVKAHMSSQDIATVKDEDEASTVLDVMQNRQIRRVPVVNSNGRLVGVIAQADIAVSDEIGSEDVAETVKEISMP